MGGFGSGRVRWRNCGAIEATLSLDVNKLNRAGCLNPGYHGDWQWSVDGEQLASIGLVAEANRLCLIYHVRSAGCDWEEIDQPTPIEWMPCRLGGTRPYFCCPGIVDGDLCRRRVLTLYGAGRYFLCRHCHRLTYACQSETAADRAWRRANKMHLRLAGDPASSSPFPGRPKGMWRRTYGRLLEQTVAAERLARDAAVMGAKQALARILTARPIEEEYRR